jgi:hypothetical protein
MASTEGSPEEMHKGIEDVGRAGSKGKGRLFARPALSLSGQTDPPPHFYLSSCGA